MPDGPRLAVVGVGLIGGSVGLAARRRLGAHVRGWDPGDGVLAAALERRAVSEACGSLAEALDGAEAAFVAAPVGDLPAAVREVLAVAGEDCVVTDVGSTKRSVVAAVDDPRRPVRGRHLVPDADGPHGRDALRPAAPAAQGPRRAPCGA